MSKPLISVVTPTWQRYNLLFGRCIPSVQKQDYPAVEHVIVHDGPAEEGAGPIAERISLLQDPYHPLRFDYMESHGPGGRIKCRLRAIENAAGDLIAYLDDDDEFREGHLSVLARALADNPGAGFAYSRMASHDGTGMVVGVVGEAPPRFAGIGTPMILHHRGILEYGSWGPERADEDWQLVERWLNAGVDYVYVEDITVDAYPSAYRGGG